MKTRTIHAAILSTGTELLQGRSVDTNSAWLSARLAENGVKTVFHMTAGDSRQDILDALGTTGSRADIIICNGGLGPTDDDLTRESAAQLFNQRLVDVPAEREILVEKYTSRSKIPRGSNLRQALFPEGAEIIPNPAGTAAGFAVFHQQKLYVFIVGVPREMKAMFDSQVLPLLKRHEMLDPNPPRRHVFKITAISESSAGEKFFSICGDVGVECGITVSEGIISAALWSTDEKKIHHVCTKVRQAFGNLIFSETGERLEQRVVHGFIASGRTLGAAESCSGGRISSLITAVPGASRIFQGSVVAYSNQLKTNLLGVSQNTLDQYGAVSPETAGEMAEGVRKNIVADIGISVTGIAGPDGGTPDKPVGTVCFGLAWESGTQTETRTFHGDRNVIQDRSAKYALFLLHRLLSENPGDAQ